jgi:hypothetical protein
MTPAPIHIHIHTRTAFVTLNAMNSDVSDEKSACWALDDLSFHNVKWVTQPPGVFFGYPELPKPQFDKSFWEELLTAENQETASDPDVRKLLALMDLVQNNSEQAQVDLLVSKLLALTGLEDDRRIRCLQIPLSLTTSHEEAWTRPQVLLMDFRGTTLPVLLVETRRTRWLSSAPARERLNPIPQVIAQAIAAYQRYELNAALRGPMPPTMVSFLRLIRSFTYIFSTARFSLRSL